MTDHFGEKDLDSTVQHLEGDNPNQSSQPETTDVENLHFKNFTWNFDVVTNITTLYMIVFVGSWASGVPASAIAFIAARFPEEASSSNWIATSQAVTSAVTVTIIGTMSDIFDRRSFLLFGCIVGAAGMLISGLANSLGMVIGGQVLNGIGIGSTFLAPPLLHEIVPKKHRPMVTGLATLFAAGSFIGAPILEGVFIQKAIGGALNGWRVGFYIGVGLYSFASVSLCIFYHPMPRPNPEGFSIQHRLLKVDWVGIFLACAGLTLFLVGINYGGNPYEWTSSVVLGTMIPGLVLLICFGLWEWKGTSTGILPHAIFQDRNYNASLIIRVVGGFALFGCQAYLPQVAVYVFGTGGLKTAVLLLPLNVSTIMGSVVAGFVLRFYKEVRWITMGLMLLLVLGSGLMALQKPSFNFVVWFFPSVLMGLSVGAENTTLTTVSGLAAPNESIATAICIGSAAAFIGGAVATTMYGQIFNAKVKDFLLPAVSKAAISAGLPESSLSQFLTAFGSRSAEALAAVPGATPAVLQAVVEASRSAYAKSFAYIWYTLIAFGVVSVASCWLFTSTTKYFTDEVAAPVVERHNKEVRQWEIKETK